MKAKFAAATTYWLLSISFFLQTAWGYDAIVQKQEFVIPSLTTVNGKTIKNVRVGYETYGKLSAKKDNVILLCHGSIDHAHFAGKYNSNDKYPGVWDHVIGPGNIIDTNKYFVIGVDSLANVLVKNPNVITTGPASINAETGVPYAMTFPIVTIADFVNTQKLVLESLGISKLHAVIGYSMGGMQALEWASRYPDMVERVIPVVAQLEQGAYNIALKDVVTSIIKLDPNWNNGNYYGKKEPEDGLVVALKAFQMTVLSYEPIDNKFGRAWAEPGKDPGASFENKFAVQAQLEKSFRNWVKGADANSWIYISQALNLFQTGHEKDLETGVKKIKAKVLFIPSKSDLLMFPDFSKRAYSMMQSMGKDVEYFELDGNMGHAEFQNIQKAEVKLRKFLN